MKSKFTAFITSVARRIPRRSTAGMSRRSDECRSSATTYEETASALRCGVFIFLPVFLLGLSKVELNQEVRTGWLALHQEQTIGQTFIAKSDNLTRIRLFTRNPNLANREPIIFHLKTSPSATEDLATLTFSGANIGWDYALRVQFTPIAHSKGKTFYFFLESPTTEATQPVEFGYNQNDNYQEGEALVNGESVGGDLFFVTFYKTTPQDLFTSSVKNFFSRVTYDKGFFITYFVILLISVMGFIWFLKEER